MWTWVNDMDLLTQLFLSIGAFALMVVVASFIGIMMAVIDDMIDEHQQARERSKKK